MLIKPAICFLVITFFGSRMLAQDTSLLNSLNDSLSANAAPTHVTGTFKATHIINMQTIESPGKGVLSFVIQHRFGQLNDGAYNFFGLDNATLRLGLDYGITDRLAVGIGRSSFEKTFDAYLKYKLLMQSDGTSKIPVSVSPIVSINNYTQRDPEKTYLNARYRTTYIGQLLIARKFNRWLSVQLAPTYLHYNLVPTVNDKNDEFALGVGGRIKITKRMSIDAEYNYLPKNQIESMKVYNSFSLGWDIETGGHVFQLIFTNSQGIVESQYVGRTTGSWGNGDIYFGFNISRNFNLTKQAKSIPSWVK